MAIIEVNFISKCLMRVVTFNAIIPVDKFGPQAENAEQKPLKTLYLLHGIFGNYTDWVERHAHSGMGGGKRPCGHYALR